MKLYLFAAVLSMCYCLSLAQRCYWGKWGAWSSCDCRRGIRVRSRDCEPSHCLERDCRGVSKDYERCCCCCLRWTNWSSWSKCTDCKRTRMRRCRKHKRKCRPKCKKQTETGNCPSYWGPWGRCSVTYGRGSQTRTKYCDSGSTETKLCLGRASLCYCTWGAWTGCRWWPPFPLVCERRRECSCPFPHCVDCVGIDKMSCRPQDCH